MAGDEDRPQPEAVDAPASTFGAHPSSDDMPEALPAQEPSMAAGAADLARPERPPAESVGAVPPAPSRSLMPTVLALIGAVLILLLAANLYTLYNPPGNEAVPALQSETAALKQRVAALEGRPTVDLGPLDTRVSALAGDIAPLKTAVDRNAQAASEAKAAVGPLGSQLDTLGGQVSGLAATVAALPKIDLTPLETRLTGAESKLEAAGTRLEGDEAKLAGVETRVGGLDTQVADVGKRLPPLEAYFNAPKAPVQATEVRQNGSAAETRAAPVAVIAQSLLGTIPTGRPFVTETKALAQLGVAPATLTPLQAVAATGAATDRDLIQGFAAAQDGIVVAAAPVSTGTMFDRMMANAESVVKVSKTGAATGDSADAIASRIVADLHAGALAAAAAAWDTLPEASRTRSADWASRLKARIAAEDAARSIGTGAVAALAAAP